MARHHIHPTAAVGELSNDQVLSVTASLTNMKIENDLKREVIANIARLKDTGTYRGRRHAINLPVRGQNTRTQVRYLYRLLFLWISLVLDCAWVSVSTGGLCMDVICLTDIVSRSKRLSSLIALIGSYKYGTNVWLME